MADAKRTDAEWRSIVADEQSAALAKVAEYGEEIDRLHAENTRLRRALDLIAAPQRPDGSWNRDREACQQIAADALRGGQG